MRSPTIRMVKLIILTHANKHVSAQRTQNVHPLHPWDCPAWPSMASRSRDCDMPLACRFALTLWAEIYFMPRSLSQNFMMSENFCEKILSVFKCGLLNVTFTYNRAVLKSDSPAVSSAPRLPARTATGWNSVAAAATGIARGSAA